MVNLEKINKKPLISSDRAKAFKSEMYNRRGIRRQTGKLKKYVILFFEQLYLKFFLF